MTKHGMPFLIINYGAEMIFILEQRLQAQKVSPEKSAKVLQDVVKSMFAPQFANELMRPQDLYSPQSTKEIFDRLAHSSIMRLSENSMDKLYDLMTMGCKFHLIVCRHPRELVELTCNHIENVLKSLGGANASGEGAECLRGTYALFRDAVKNMSTGQVADVRHRLLTFFQGKRTKVSLFLQEKFQNNDGTFNVTRCGEAPTDGPFEPPGLIRYFDNGHMTTQEAFHHPDSGKVTPHPNHKPDEPSAHYDPLDAKCRTTPLGANLYLIERKKDGASPSTAPVDAPPPPPAAPASASPLSRSSGSPRRSLNSSTSFRRRMEENAGKQQLTSNAAALNSLSSLIAPAPATGEAMHLNLFGDHDDDDNAAPAAGGCDDGAAAERTIQIQPVSRDDVLKNNTELAGLMKGLDVTGPPAQDAGGDDLLDLMDN